MAVTANPYTHHCGVRDVDYSKIKNGQVNCTACGAKWLLNPNRGWQRQPEIGRPYKRKSDA